MLYASKHLPGKMKIECVSATDDIWIARQGLGTWRVSGEGMSAYIVFDRTANAHCDRVCYRNHHLSCVWESFLEYNNAETVLMFAVGDMRVQRLR